MSHVSISCIILVCTLASASFQTFARTGANASNAFTDIYAPDSITLYQEESDRAELIRDSKVIFVNGDSASRAGRDSVEQLLAKFYLDQYRNSQDPDAPLFTFMTKEANYAMGIGGAINLNAWFDWNGIVPNEEFNVYNISMPKTPENMKAVGASASASKLFFNIMGRNTPVGFFRAYIEAGFYGYGDPGFKLKRAWFQVKDFTVGLAKSTFSDPAAQPEVLDYAGANGRIDRANVLARYLHTWHNRWSVAGSVEFSTTKPREVENMTAKVRDYVPDFAAMGQFQWDRGMSHVRIAALIRNMAYRDLVAAKNRNVVGWGVELSSIIRAGRHLTFYALGSIGQGIATYTGDLYYGHADMLPYLDRPGQMYAPTTVSATAGLKVQIMKKLSSTICLSTLRHYAKGNLSDDTYKYGQYLAANIVYQITPRLMAGAEYLAGKRMNFNGEHGNANRVLISCGYSF